MIGLVTFLTVMSILFLLVEIPTFIRRREEEDGMIILASALVLAGCLAILFWWGCI